PRPAPSGAGGRRATSEGYEGVSSGSGAEGGGGGGAPWNPPHHGPRGEGVDGLCGISVAGSPSPSRPPAESCQSGSALSSAPGSGTASGLRPDPYFSWCATGALLDEGVFFA